MLLNEHTLVWLDGPEPDASGNWSLPPVLARQVQEQYLAVAEQRFETHRHGSLVVVRAVPALVERPAREQPLEALLDPTQVSLVRLMLAGLTGGQIARRLGMSRRKFWYEVAEIKKRLGVTTRAELIRKAEALGREEE